jgi:hypothetical protein
MALWMTALKLVPWSDVIEATPKIVKGARTLFTSTMRRKPEEAKNASDSAETTQQLANDPASLATRLVALQDRVSKLEDEQHASAELIASLAEQNAEIVRVVDGLRRRQRLLGSVCLVLIVAVLMLVIRVAQHV